MAARSTTGVSAEKRREQVLTDLKDGFACKAMEKLIEVRARLDPDALADAAYSRAEAMLKRRAAGIDDALRTRVDKAGNLFVRNEASDA